MNQLLLTGMVRTRLIIITLFSVVTLSACGGGGGGGGTTNAASPTSPTSGSNPATTAPAVNSAVASVTPTDKSLNVPVNLKNIIATFDKPIDPNTLNTGTFIVSNGMTGTVTTTNNNTQAIFTLDVALSRNATYTVTLDGVTDSTGVPILANNQQAYQWSFTTCGDISLSTYTVSWDPVVDTDLSGYKIYYGLSSPLTRTNADSIILGNVTSWQLKPVNLGYVPCDEVQVSVSSLGNTKGESNLSLSESVIIN